MYSKSKELLLMPHVELAVRLLTCVYKSHKLCFSAFPAVFIKQHKNNMESMKNTTEEVVCFPYSAFFGWVCVSADDICRSSGLVLSY